MASKEDIAHQQELLDLHRGNLHRLLQQQIRMGGEAFVQPVTLNGIEEARRHIRRIKQWLREAGVDAPNLPDDEPPNTRVSEPISLPQDQARVGLQALASLMNALQGVPSARSAIAVYQASFAEANHQIRILNDHKMLHDLFQQIEMDYAVVTRQAKGALDTPSAWDQIEPHESALYSRAEGLLRYAAEVPFVAETAMWTPMLSRAQAEMREGFRELDAEQFRRGVNRFKKVIDSQLSRTDASLKEAAKALHLLTLIASLRQICDYLDSLPFDGANEVVHQQIAVFREGVDALAKLDIQLSTAITQHTNFQAFDDELRRVERMFEQDLNELIDAWHDIRPMMLVLCDKNDQPWATELMRLGINLAHAIAEGQPRQIRLAFRDYRHYATTCFHQVDVDLLRFCSDLSSIGATLDGIARMM